MTRWVADDDSEYNEQSTDVGGHRVTIFSDRDGERWECTIGDETFPLEATNAHAARREAEEEARRWTM